MLLDTWTLRKNATYRHQKGKSSQYRYDSLYFENSTITVFDTLLFITDLIYAAAPPPY